MSLHDCDIIIQSHQQSNSMTSKQTFVSAVIYICYDVFLAFFLIVCGYIRQFFFPKLKIGILLTDLHEYSCLEIRI